MSDMLCSQPSSAPTDPMMAPIPDFSGCRRDLLACLGALIVALSGIAASQTHAQDIGRLYAAKPPPGYAFVRVVVMVEGDMPRVQIDARDLPIGERATASSYRAVPGGRALNLTVDGSTISGPIAPRPDAYLTLAIAKTGAAWSAHAIDEGQSAGDGLKARLRFFNLVSGCTATLKLSDGPTIFDQAPFESVQARTINPVTAKLEGSCGEGGAAQMILPQLRAGDSYSIFLRKGADRLSLAGQQDETETFRER